LCRTLAAGLVALTAVACGSGEVSDGGAQRFASIGTAPPGGAFFVVGGALADVLNESSSDIGLRVTTEATKGSQENIRRLARGELDFALSNSAITYFAMRGESGWDQAYPMRAVMTLASNVALFVTTANSGITSITDLAGQRVAVGPAGAGFEFFQEPMLAAHGISYADFTQLYYGTQSAAVDMLADGSAAAVFLGGAVPTASITQVASSQDVRFVPFDPQAREELIANYLFFRPATIPAGTYRGQDTAYEGLDVGSMHLITTAATDEDLVYKVTKALYENSDHVTQRHPAGRAINAGNVVRNTGTQFHPGAIRYYREIGIWPEE
jgi:hypothetical protein